jgi:HEAT repeat protein
MTERAVLDDSAMRQFIIEGYLVLHPQFADGFHEQICEHLEKVFEGSGNPGNNLLPRVPRLMDVWRHPVVDGALSSILGDDYYLHMHRHVHDTPPDSGDQGMHKDSLHNSRFAADGCRRHHRTRWLMGFYYPQDTPVEMGPTAIIPKSQYLNVDLPEEDEVPLTGEKGTVVLVHYDLRHRKMLNSSDQTRFMNKFLFTRMSEPAAPTWDTEGGDWQATDHEQDEIWRHTWDWHRGKGDVPPPDESVDALVEQLDSEKESTALTASYRLGRSGSAALPALTDAICDESDKLPRNAAYAFNENGSPALPSLEKLANDKNELVRARALDIMGDIGLRADAAVPTLEKSCCDESEDVRMFATEALGTAGQRSGCRTTTLAERLEHDESWKVRRNAALSLARLGDKAEDSVPALARSLNDENHYVRGYSVLALDRIGTHEALTSLSSHLQTARWDG